MKTELTFSELLQQYDTENASDFFNALSDTVGAIARPRTSQYALLLKLLRDGQFTTTSYGVNIKEGSRPQLNYSFMYDKNYLEVNSCFVIATMEGKDFLMTIQFNYSPRLAIDGTVICITSTPILPYVNVDWEEAQE